MLKNDFLIRLDYPLSEQTYLHDLVEVRGWILVPDCQDLVSFKSQLKLELLLSNLSYYESLSHAGTPPPEETVTIIDSSNDFDLRNLELIPADRYNSPDLEADGSPKVTGTMLNFKALLFRKNNYASTKSLRVSFCLNNKRYYSNHMNLILSNKELFGSSPKGGPICPIAREIFSGYYIAQGWFYKGGKDIKNITARVHGSSSIKVYYGEKQEYLLSSLPDINREELIGIEVISKFEDPSIRTKISFNLDILFEDGTSSTMYWGSTYLLPENELLFVANIFEEIDHYCINGYYSIVSALRPKFVLLTTQGEKEIPENYLTIKLDSLDSGLASKYISGKVNFQIRIPKGHFPNFLGSVDLALYSGDNVVYSSGIQVRKRLSNLLNNISDIQTSNSPKLIFKKMLSSGFLPIKKHERIKESQNIGTGLSFFFHNLSLTEGAPKVALLLHKYLPKKLNLEVINSVTFKSGEGDNYVRENSKNFLVLPEAQPSWKSFGDYQQAYLKLVENIKANFPEKAVVNSLDSFLAIDVLSSLNIPTIWIIHESIDPFIWYQKLPLEIRSRFLNCLRVSTKVVFVSSRTEALYKELISSERSSVITNGINSTAFIKKLGDYSKVNVRSELDIDEDEIVFLSVGTTTERKGQDITIRELKKFKELYLNEYKGKTNWRLLIVGAREIPFLDKLKTTISELNLDSHVILIPETSEVSKYYAASDLFILSSREESSPLVILEAYAVGLPVFSTLVFGLKDLIKEDIAQDFDPNISGDLADKLMNYVKDPKKCLEKAKLAKDQVCKEFSEEKMISNYLDLFKKLQS